MVEQLKKLRDFQWVIRISVSSILVPFVIGCAAPVVETPGEVGSAKEDISSNPGKTPVKTKIFRPQVSRELHKKIERFVIGNIRAVQKLAWKNLDSFADTRQWMERHASHLPTAEREGYLRQMQTPEGKENLKERLHRRAMRMFKSLKWPMKVTNIETRQDGTFAVSILSEEREVPHRLIVGRFDNAWKLVNIEYAVAR